MKDKIELLTQEQIDNVEEAVRRGMSDFTQEDVERVIRFITAAALSFAAARMILDGTMDAKVVDGEVQIAPRLDHEEEVLH